MMRRLFGTLAVALLLCVSAVLASEIKGKITKVDPDKHTVTLSVDDKETEYKVAADADLGKTKGGDKATLEDLKKALEKSKAGTINATITTETKGGKEVVTKVERAKGKGKKGGGGQ